MDHRPLGRTGVQVSKLCLGTMMFGAWGNTDHDDSIRVIHRALDADEMTAIDGLETGKRGGPEPDAITLETFGRDIPEA